MQTCKFQAIFHERNLWYGGIRQEIIILFYLHAQRCPWFFIFTKMPSLFDFILLNESCTNTSVFKIFTREMILTTNEEMM